MRGYVSGVWVWGDESMRDWRGGEGNPEGGLSLEDWQGEMRSLRGPKKMKDGRLCGRC